MTEKIHVVTVSSGWILQKLAERIAEAGDFTVGTFPNPSVDANLYIDSFNCFHRKTNTLDFGMFTHMHESDPTTIPPITFKLDHIFHMSEKYRDMFEDESLFPADRMTVLEPGEIPDWCDSTQKTRIGIFQRGGFIGKGSEVMENILKKDVSSEIEWYFVGKGWKDSLKVNQTESGERVVTHFLDEPQYYWEYSDLYRQIDYLLIPSLWEGGPMAYIEACALGIPVISADVGFVRQIGKYEHMFEPGNVEELADILMDIRDNVNSRRLAVEHITHKRYSEEVKRVVRKIKVNG